MSYKPRQDYFSDSGSSSRSTYAPKSDYFSSSYDATHPKSLAKEITKQEKQRDQQKEQQRQQAKQSAFSKIKSGVVNFGKEAAHDVTNSAKQLSNSIISATSGTSNLKRQNQNVDAVAKSNQQAHDAFKQGKISKDQYTKILKSGGESLNSSQKVTSQIEEGANAKHTVGAGLSLGSLLIPEVKGVGIVAKKAAPKLAEKLVAKASEKSAKGLAIRAAETGAKLAPSGAGFGVGDSLQKDKSLKDTAKTVAIDALAAGGLGAAGKVAGETIGKAAETGRMKLGKEAKATEKPQLPTDVVEVLGADEARLTAQKLATASSPEVADKIIMDTQAKIDMIKNEASIKERVTAGEPVQPYTPKSSLDIKPNTDNFKPATPTKSMTTKPTEKPPVINKEFHSKVYARLKAEHPELSDELSYEGVNLKKDAENAVNLIAKDKNEAFSVAMGSTKSKDVTSTATNIAMAEKALEEGNHDLYARLVKNRSLAQTRRGQELVAEKGSVTDNSTSRYVKELIATKLEKVGKQYLGDVRDKLGKTSSKERATRAIDKEVTKLEKQVRGGKLDVKTALGLLDKASCL